MNHNKQTWFDLVGFFKSSFTLLTFNGISLQKTIIIKNQNANYFKPDVIGGYFGKFFINKAKLSSSVWVCELTCDWITLFSIKSNGTFSSLDSPLS